MKLTRTLLASAVFMAIVVPAAHAEIAIDVIAGSEVTFEGLLQYDGNWYDNDVQDLNGNTGNNGSDSEFGLRRAELVLKGKGPGNIDWVLGYDASTLKEATNNGTTVRSTGKFLDTNIKYKFGGNSNNYVILGQYKQPNSLEELSSTKNNDFISKASVTNTYAVARRLGAGVGFGDNNWSVTGSAFGRELTRNLAHGSGFGARGTFAPINDGGNVLHFGLSYNDYDTDADTLRLRARPNADLASVRLVDSGNLTDTDRIAVLGAEAMYITGPFKAQGEYYNAKVNRELARSDYTSDGWYVSGVWNITGEKFGYKAGVPTTGLPDEPARGMWQVGVRYDDINLDDGSVIPPTTPTGRPTVDGVLGGEMSTWTVGVNYYWRSNFKLALNYVMAKSTKWNTTTRTFVDDDPNILEARAQFYW
jgi:phosphate-selective porin OprO/OprP